MMGCMTMSGSIPRLVVMGENRIGMDNWLHLAGDLEDREYLYIHPRGSLTIEEAMQALKAQYPGSRYRVTTHGQQMYVINGPSNDVRIKYADSARTLKSVQDWEIQHAEEERQRREGKEKK
jgi:hypothetical protein